MIKKASYDNLSWVDALKAKTAKPKYDGSGPEDLDNVLERTVEAAFKSPTTEQTSEQKISEASKGIQQKVSEDQLASRGNGISEKLSTRGIDPVALGVATKEAWAQAVSSNPDVAEEIAKKAALAYQKHLKTSWQDKSMEQKTTTMAFDHASLPGKIMSSMSATEEVTPRINKVPANAASILEPGRLDAFAKAPNAHDDSVKASRELAKQREADLKKHEFKVPDGAVSMKAGQVVASGAANDTSAFVHRAPRDQISIMDNVGAIPADQLKEKLANMFGRIKDTGTEIRAANAARREAIQGKKAEKEAINLKPLTSTKDIEQKIRDSWMPPAPEK